MSSPAIENLVKALSRLPGLGPRSARRATLALLQKKESLLAPLLDRLNEAANQIKTCTICGNLDTEDPCTICASDRRDKTQLCIVEQVADLWAMERSRLYKGQYHVLGGVLSALDGVTPDDLSIAALIHRAASQKFDEIILALNATVDGQATAHYLSDRLQHFNIKMTRLASGIPLGGELDYLDEGTLALALQSRQNVN